MSYLVASSAMDPVNFLKIISWRNKSQVEKASTCGDACQWLLKRYVFSQWVAYNHVILSAIIWKLAILHDLMRESNHHVNVAVHDEPKDQAGLANRVGRGKSWRSVGFNNLFVVRICELPLTQFACPSSGALESNPYSFLVSANHSHITRTKWLRL